MFRKALAFAAFAIFLAASVANANLVSNGDFETGDLALWNVNGNAVFAFANGAGHTGNFEALLGITDGVASLSQSITTTSGQSYLVSFWLASDTLPGDSSSFQALWNGTPMTTTPGLQNYIGAFDYTQFIFTGVATGAITTIAFDFQNDGSAFHLDDVSANPVPEPSTFILFGAGLAGLGGFRFTMKKVA